MLTRTEADLLERYRRARRGYAELRLGLLWTTTAIASPGRPVVLDDGERAVRELRRRLEDFLRAEDALRDHVSEHGPIEDAWGIYRLDGLGRLGRLPHERGAASSR